MIPWWWLIIAVFGGFLFGFFVFSIMKVSSDADRLWQGYYQKLESEKEKENDSISNVRQEK